MIYVYMYIHTRARALTHPSTQSPTPPPPTHVETDAFEAHCIRSATAYVSINPKPYTMSHRQTRRHRHKTPSHSNTTHTQVEKGGQHGRMHYATFRFTQHFVSTHTVVPRTGRKLLV